MRVLLVLPLLGACWPAPPRPPEWMEIRGTAVRVEARYAERPTPWKSEPRRYTFVEVAPDLTHTTRRFEEMYGYWFRKEERGSYARPARVETDDTLGFGFLEPLSADIVAGARVVVCWDVRSSQEGDVRLATAARTCADDSGPADFDFGTSPQ